MIHICRNKVCASVHVGRAQRVLFADLHFKKVVLLLPKCIGGIKFIPLCRDEYDHNTCGAGRGVK